MRVSLEPMLAEFSEGHLNCVWLTWVQVLCSLPFAEGQSMWGPHICIQTSVRLGGSSFQNDADGALRAVVKEAGMRSGSISGPS